MHACAVIMTCRNDVSCYGLRRASPNLESSPEILCIRNAMDRIGCDLCLDIHGSEGIPRVWGTLCTGWTPRLAGLCDEFLDGWARVAGPAFDRCEKRHFLSHLDVKTNILPRQAREKT